MQPRALSRAVLSIALGALAVSVTRVAGFVVVGLEEAEALAVVFVLVVVATLFGPTYVARAVRAHPLLSLAVLALVVPFALLFLAGPVYITAAQR